MRQINLPVPDTHDAPLIVNNSKGFTATDLRACIISYFFQYICEICRENSIDIPFNFVVFPRLNSNIGYSVDLYRRSEFIGDNSVYYFTLYFNKYGKFIPINSCQAT